MRAGGVGAAVAGPELAKRTHDLVDGSEFLGSYLILGVLGVVGMALVSALNISAPSAQERTQSGRPLATIVHQPSLVIAILVGMVAYSVMILAACLAIVPVGKLNFPGLADADQVFLRVMESEFPPVIRGIAVAAVLAAVMSTTDALLLACSSAIAHDLLGNVLRERASERTNTVIRIGSAWGIGLLALYWAFSPPELISQFYTAGVGILSASLFVPTVAGIWWKRANLLGGVLALVLGAVTYVAIFFFEHFAILDIGLSPILVALPAGAVAMLVGGLVGHPESDAMLEQIANLHRSDAETT